MKIVTNSQKPGEKKDWRENTLFSIYSSFADEKQIEELKNKFEEGIGWGDAKLIVYEDLNKILSPIKDRFESLQSQEKNIEDMLQENAKKVRKITVPLIERVKLAVGL